MFNFLPNLIKAIMFCALASYATDQESPLEVFAKNIYSKIQCNDAPQITDTCLHLLSFITKGEINPLIKEECENLLEGFSFVPLEQNKACLQAINTLDKRKDALVSLAQSALQSDEQVGHTSRAMDHSVHTYALLGEEKAHVTHKIVSGYFQEQAKNETPNTLLSTLLLLLASCSSEQTLLRFLSETFRHTTPRHNPLNEIGYFKRKQEIVLKKDLPKTERHAFLKAIFSKSTIQSFRQNGHLDTANTPAGFDRICALQNFEIHSKSIFINKKTSDVCWGAIADERLKNFSEKEKICAQALLDHTHCSLLKKRSSASEVFLTMAILVLSIENQRGTYFAELCGHAPSEVTDILRRHSQPELEDALKQEALKRKLQPQKTDHSNLLQISLAHILKPIHDAKLKETDLRPVFLLKSTLTCSPVYLRAWAVEQKAGIVRPLTTLALLLEDIKSIQLNSLYNVPDLFPMNKLALSSEKNLHFHGVCLKSIAYSVGHDASNETRKLTYDFFKQEGGLSQHDVDFTTSLIKTGGEDFMQLFALDIQTAQMLLLTKSASSISPDDSGTAMQGIAGNATEWNYLTAHAGILPLCTQAYTSCQKLCGSRVNEHLVIV